MPKKDGAIRQLSSEAVRESIRNGDVVGHQITSNIEHDRETLHYVYPNIEDAKRVRYRASRLTENEIRLSELAGTFETSYHLGADKFRVRVTIVDLESCDISEISCGI